MNREETIELKAAVGRLMYANNKDVRDYNALIDFIESALRPVSREQIEKVWKNCEYCTQDSTRREVLGYDAAGDAISIELGCNIAAISSDCTEVLIRFCPMCGTPLTDEAVEMVIRRLEILKDEA